MSKVPPKRTLPSKEAALFKELLNLYENRQLKKGVKTADQILKKFPEHGETLCMKGLVVTHMGRREEGIDLVKKGVRLDLTSHICWHVFGLIQKGEKNYEEALKSYTQALKFDRDNINILRDSAQLQTQLRMFDALVETRLALLKLRPNLRQHWIALAVAHYLAGNLDEAGKVMAQYQSSLKNVPDYDLEQSETNLFHIRLLIESGAYTSAMALLDVNAKSRAIVDKSAIMEIRADLLTKQEKGSDEAEHAWRVLVEHNPDCYHYYDGYLDNLSVDPEQDPTRALEILAEFSSQIPKALTPRRLALKYSPASSFADLVKPYLLSALTKGVPSVFADIKSLCRDQAKMQIIQDYVEELKAQHTPTVENLEKNKDRDPTIYLWILYFLAQHYSYLALPAQSQSPATSPSSSPLTQRSLDVLASAIEHTPTLPELYTLRARVLKRSGDFLGAAREMNAARLLDLQDRFLNTKSAKYWLRAGCVEKASEVAGLFTKKDAPSPASDLEDMQSLLWVLEEADLYFRTRGQRQADGLNGPGDWSKALKRYVGVAKIFDEIEDDQYDFHGYSIRKFTVSIYLTMLKWADSLRLSHPAYSRAVIGATKILVAVHDDPNLAKTGTANGQLTDAEKKAKKKAKKAAASSAKADDGKKAANSTNEDKGLEPTPPKDDDPEGTKLIAEPSPLERAAKLLQPLVSQGTKSVQVWVLVYDVAIRRAKLLQAVQALHHAHALEPHDPELHIRLVDCKKRVSTVPEASVTGPLFTEALSKLLPDERSLETFNSQYLQRHSNNAAAILAAAKVSQVLGSSQDEINGIVFGAFNEGVDLSMTVAQEILKFLGASGSNRRQEFREKCDEKFTLSTIFERPDELERLKKEALSAGLLVNGSEPTADAEEKS